MDVSENIKGKGQVAEDMTIYGPGNTITTPVEDANSLGTIFIVDGHGYRVSARKVTRRGRGAESMVK